MIFMLGVRGKTERYGLGIDLSREGTLNAVSSVWSLCAGFNTGL